MMNSESRESEGDEAELRRIRERKMAEISERGHESSNKPVHVTDLNFNETTGKHELALIDFWASWCGPCQALAPTIEELARDYASRLFVGKLNVDENPQTAECFQVFSIPTMLIMKNGKEVDRIVGCVQKKYIEGVLKKHLE
jgi:thioredoxin 1